MLTGIVDDRDTTEWPVTHRTRHTTIAHDSLYRVMGVSYQCRLGGSSTGTDASSDWRGEAAPSNTNDPSAAGQLDSFIDRLARQPRTGP